MTTGKTLHLRARPGEQDAVEHCATADGTIGSGRARSDLGDQAPATLQTNAAGRKPRRIGEREPPPHDQPKDRKHRGGERAGEGAGSIQPHLGSRHDLDAQPSTGRGRASK